MAAREYSGEDMERALRVGDRHAATIERLSSEKVALLAALEALFTEAGEHAIDCDHEFTALDGARGAIRAARGEA